MIRKAEKVDVEDVHRLICILEEEDFTFTTFKQMYNENLSNDTIHYYVYQEQNKIVGFISLYQKSLLHHNGRTGEIVELIIDPEYRSQHIGEKLLYHIFDLARALQLQEIELSTNVKRTKAQEFYERHGFIKNHYNLVKKI